MHRRGCGCNGLEFLRQRLVDLVHLATILQQVIGAPLSCLRTSEHVVLTMHVQLLLYCEDPARFPLAFLSSILPVAVLATVVLSLTVLAVIFSTATFTGVVEPGRY